MKNVWFLVLTIPIVLTTTVSATEPIARDEGNLECTVCHQGKKGRKLTDQGKYYEAVRTLGGFDELEERFRECTYCHAQQPGSLDLTEEGRRYQWMMEDMEGIREWLMERHLDPERVPPEPEGN